MNRANRAFIIAVSSVIAATVVICAAAFACAPKKLGFSACYYFVCYKAADNAVSASSLSNAAENSGGAGYILEYGGSYYVTVACYYTENEAGTVSDKIKDKMPDCFVLGTETAVKITPSAKKRNGELYLGNLNTLDSLSRLAYECANGLDTGAYSQSKAKDIISSLEGGLNGLLSANADNCFTEKLTYLTECAEDISDGYILSGSLRFLQIAAIDCIVNCGLLS